MVGAIETNRFLPQCPRHIWVMRGIVDDMLQTLEGDSCQLFKKVPFLCYSIGAFASDQTSCHIVANLQVPRIQILNDFGIAFTKPDAQNLGGGQNQSELPQIR